MVRKNSGFTMVELMIVIAIIGILAVTLIPAFSGMQNRAKDTGVSSAVNSASTALDAWKSDTNSAFAIGASNALAGMSGTFTSLKAASVCATQSSTVGTVSVWSGASVGCTTANPHSFWYVPAQQINANDTYLIWAKMFTPARGTLKALTSTVAANGTATGGAVDMAGNQTISSVGYYAVHGANRQ